MLISIQLLRAIASILVLIHHIKAKDEIYSNGLLSFFTFGEIGVDIFFIISGFIMYFIYQRKIIQPIEFIYHRIIRIMPLYWLLTLIALFIYLIIPEKVNSSGGVTFIVESFFLIPVEGKFLIQNGWTLTYEFLFYFIFMIALIIKDIRIVFFIILILSIFGYLLNFDNIYYNYLTNNILLEFLLGIVSFRIYVILKDSENYILFSLGFILFGIILLSLFINNDFIKNYRIIYYGIPSFFFFIGILLLEKKMINIKSILFLGNSSYSLYLIHPFVLAGFSLVYLKLNLNAHMISEFLYILIMFFTSLYIAHLLHEYIEKNIINYLNKLFKIGKYKNA
jgi:exopolysaccharide production protein ExoZ